MVKLTQKNFNDMIIAFNHKMTKVETSIRWIKYIIGYMATLITAILVIVVS